MTRLRSALERITHIHHHSPTPDPRGELMTITQTGTVEVTTTVTINGVAKTFTATGQTAGDPARTARGILGAVQDDAAKWTFDVAKESR